MDWSSMINQAGRDYSGNVRLSKYNTPVGEYYNWGGHKWTDPRPSGAFFGEDNGSPYADDSQSVFAPSQAGSDWSAGFGPLTPTEVQSGGRAMNTDFSNGMSMSGNSTLPGSSGAQFTLPKLPNLGGAPAMPSTTLAQYMNSGDVKQAVAEKINNMNRPHKRAITDRKGDLKKESSVIGDLAQSKRTSLGVSSKDSQKRAKAAQEQLKGIDRDTDEAYEKSLERISSLIVGNSGTQADVAEDNQKAAARDAAGMKSNREQAEGQAAREGSLLDEYSAAAHQSEANDKEYARDQANEDIGRYRGAMSDNAAMQSEFAREIGNQMLDRALQKHSLQAQAAQAANSNAMQMYNAQLQANQAQYGIDQEAAERSRYGGLTFAQRMQVEALKAKGMQEQEAVQQTISGMSEDGTTEFNFKGAFGNPQWDVIAPAYGLPQVQ